MLQCRVLAYDYADRIGACTVCDIGAAQIYARYYRRLRVAGMKRFKRVAVEYYEIY